MFSRIVERLSLICGRGHNWPNHVKTLVHLFVDLFIFVFLNSYECIKVSEVITNSIRASRLKIYRRTKYYRAHKIDSMQGGDCYNIS